MIFATVGTQLPFDRMIETLEKWKQNQSSSKVFAQTGTDGMHPQSIDFAPNLTPTQFARNIAKCKVIVSHAGMGTILTALGAGKPIIIMPRLAKYGEHRNDHQLATVANLRGRTGIHVAMNEQELMTKLDQLGTLKASKSFSQKASPQLLTAVSHFISPAEDQETCYAL